MTTGDLLIAAHSWARYERSPHVYHIVCCMYSVCRLMVRLCAGGVQWLTPCDFPVCAAVRWTRWAADSRSSRPSCGYAPTWKRTRTSLCPNTRSTTSTSQYRTDRAPPAPFGRRATAVWPLRALGMWYHKHIVTILLYATSCSLIIPFSLFLFL